MYVTIFGHLEYQGQITERYIALTFDDGPYPETTYEVLEILAVEEIVATFSINGQAIEEYPAETKAITEAGHELGNHSYSHPRMIYMSYGAIKSEMERTDKAMITLGYEPKGYVRSPYCKKLFTFPWYLVQPGQINVTWTVELNLM